jgi:hypothetical protein
VRYEQQIYGSWLAFRITLRVSGVTLGASLMDNPEGRWDLLLRTTDDGPGWDTVRRFAASLERNGVRSLQRPIESGEPGVDGDAWELRSGLPNRSARRARAFSSCAATILFSPRSSLARPVGCGGTRRLRGMNLRSFWLKRGLLIIGILGSRRTG